VTFASPPSDVILHSRKHSSLNLQAIASARGHILDLLLDRAQAACGGRQSGAEKGSPVVYVEEVEGSLEGLG